MCIGFGRPCKQSRESYVIRKKVRLVFANQSRYLIDTDIFQKAKTEIEYAKCEKSNTVISTFVVKKCYGESCIDN